LITSSLNTFLNESKYHSLDFARLPLKPTKNSCYLMDLIIS
jgi:hypothetical protein